MFFRDVASMASHTARPGRFLGSVAAILICQKSATLYLPSSTVLFILSVFCGIRDKHISIRGRLQRMSSKIWDFQTTPPPLVRVCPNFQNHPPLPGRPRPDFSIFTHFSIFTPTSTNYYQGVNCPESNVRG